MYILCIFCAFVVIGHAVDVTLFYVTHFAGETSSTQVQSSVVLSGNQGDRFLESVGILKGEGFIIEPLRGTNVYRMQPAKAATTRQGAQRQHRKMVKRIAKLIPGYGEHDPDYGHRGKQPGNKPGEAREPQDHEQ